MTKSNNTLKANKDLPLITDLEVNSILDSLILGKTSIEIAKDLQIPLTKLYKILDQDEKLKEQFGKAQEIGMRTLIEKMLIVFDNKPDNLEASDMLFLREKKDFLKWLAPKVSSFFVEKQQQNIKTDQTITIKFDSGIDEKVIELDPEKFEFTPSTSSNEVKINLVQIYP
jgi:hypothetical protein